MTEVVVVGIGSPFGADRLGWEVVEQLQGADELRAYPSEQLALQAVDRPGAGLLGYLRGAQLALLVDAVQAELAVGSLLRLCGDELDTAPQGFSSHGFGVADTLALGRVLGGLPPRLVLLGVEVGPDAQAAPRKGHVDRLVCAVLAELRRFYGPGCRAAHA